MKMFIFPVNSVYRSTQEWNFFSSPIIQLLMYGRKVQGGNCRKKPANQILYCSKEIKNNLTLVVRIYQIIQQEVENPEKRETQF